MREIQVAYINAYAPCLAVPSHRTTDDERWPMDRFGSASQTDFRERPSSNAMLDRETEDRERRLDLVKFIVAARVMALMADKLMENIES